MGKKKKIVIGVVIALILIAVAVIGFIMVNQAKNSPEEVLKTYVANINEKKYEEMYELISEDSKASISKEDFLKRNRNIYEGIGMENMQVEIKEVSKNSSNPTIQYHTSMNTEAGEIAFDHTVSFVKDKEKKYVIQWSSNLIFPDLNGEDKVNIKTLASDRGTISDRNGVMLAGKGEVSSVGLVPGKMEENKETSIAKIAELLEVSADSIKSDLNASYVKDDTFVPIKKIAKDNQTVKNALLQIPGVKITSETSRVYPLGEEISQLVGYVQAISAEELEKNQDKGYTKNSIIGKAGLEKSYEDRLRGIDGAEITIIDASGNIKKQLAKKEAKNGENIKLTIDSNMQSKLYAQLKQVKSSFVVMNPKTGEVLALVSTPSYDSNDFTMGMSNSQWNSLKENPNNPLLNRYTNTWSPGSTFKPVTGAIGVSSGKIDPQENFGTSGLSWQKDESWGSYQITTLTPYSTPANLQNALIYSDNIYFAKAALKIGADTYVEYLKKAGFNETIPFDQALDQSTYSNTEVISSEVQLADSGYGQGQILVNPVHMASIYSSFVNEGNMVKPYIEYQDNQKVEYLKEQVFTKEAVQTIKEDLVQVVESPNGTAHDAKVAGQTLGGKTGTAELKKSKEEQGEILGWYNSFSADSASEKQYVVISMVEDAGTVGGSHYLFPIVKSVFEM